MTKRCLKITIKTTPKEAKFNQSKLENMRNPENVVHFSSAFS